VRVGIHLSDIPAGVPATQQFADIRRLVEAAQRSGFTAFSLGQHFLYGDIRWLQPVPLLARLAADVEPDVRLISNILIAPLYHPVLLAEEIATLDVVTEGRYVLGVGLGYRPEEFDALGVPHKERAARLDELLELLPLLWTKDEVTFEGRFWQLRDVRPHLRPIQVPHPPIWVGGVTVAGARRAGRLGDGYLTNPEAEPPEIRERLQAVRDGFAARGRPMTPQPLRRNIMLGRSIEDAVERYLAVSLDRYVAYAQRGLDVYRDADLSREFAAMVQRHALLGTPDAVIEQVTRLAELFPIDPLLLRPQWPSMSTDDAIALVNVLGRDVVPALREIQPRTDLPDAEL
jgi:alkanesulfonate monooxygenase SsuD/methylene tetrahydromethanopterin reductase-like flavin-dependent oxidoreductase (luciferase family)